MKSSNTLFAVASMAAFMMMACPTQSPADAGPSTAETRSTEKNFCPVQGGDRQCYKAGGDTEERRQAQEFCDCDDDHLLDSEGLRTHPLCVKYYNGAATDPDLCHFSPAGVATGGSSGTATTSGTGTSNGGGNNGGSSGGTSNAGNSNMGTGSSSGGTATSFGPCDLQGGIINVNCDSGGATSGSTATSSASTGGNASSSPDPCDPQSSFIPAYCGNWSGSSSSGSNATSMSTATSASAGSSSNGGQGTSNAPVLWQFKDMCAAAPGGYGNWDVLRPAGRDAQGNAMVDFNLCQLLWAFDTQDANLRCDPNLPIRWVGTDVNAEAGRTGSDLLNFNYAFGRNVGPVTEQYAGHVWARYVPTPVTQNRVVEGVLRCSSPGGFGDLQSAVQRGRSLDFINVVSQNPFNARMIFTQTPQASGGSTSSSAGGTGNSMGTASSMGAGTSMGNAASMGGTASSTGSSATSSAGGPTGGPVGYELGRPDPQVPGAVLFNIRNFSPMQQQYFLLGTTKAVCLSCSFATGIQAELVFKQDNTVEEIRVRPEIDGMYEWRLMQAGDSTAADFNTPCENGVGGASCRKYTNIGAWYSSWNITTVSGVRRAVPQGGVDGQPGVNNGTSAELKAYGTGGNTGCKATMPLQVRSACWDAVPIHGSSITHTNIMLWVGMYVSNAELVGYRVVYNETCIPEQMYCQTDPVPQINSGDIQLFASKNRPFRIEVVVHYPGEPETTQHAFTLNLSRVSVPGNVSTAGLNCSNGFHFENGSCIQNSRLSVVPVNGAALLQID